MKRLAAIWFGALVALCGEAKAEITIETARLRLVLGEDAIVKSLKLQETGEECLYLAEPMALFAVTQDRPFNNEIKLIEPNVRTVWQAGSIRQEGERLIVGFPHRQYEAVVRPHVRPEYVAFELEDFRCDRKATYNLQMDVPPVTSFRVLQLPVKNRCNFGKWLNASWDDTAAIAVVATSPYPDISHEERAGYRILSADLVQGRKLRGASAALIVGKGREDFLDCMDRLERDFELPLGVESRRSDIVKDFIYHVSGRVTPENIDRHIFWAQRGGFRCMTFLTESFTKSTGSWGLHGDYDWNGDYPKGAEDVKKVVAKVKAAGIRPGLHFLHTHIGMKSRYVTPVADPRLNKTRRFTLAKPLGAVTNETEITVFESTEDAPKYGPCRVLQFGGELVSYESYTREPPYCFLGVKRGAWNTRVAAHARGDVGGVLDISEFGAPMSCYLDQNSDLQDEVAVKIAAIYNCGFEYAYFDGSEGVNRPFGFHVANAQYRQWKRFSSKPLFSEGAAKTHFGWHILSGANAFDCFGPEIFKEKIVEFPVAQAPKAWQDMTRVNFGWWAYFPKRTRPDHWQFACSQCLGWDCPATIIVDAATLDADCENAEPCFEVMRIWNEARRQNLLTAAQKEKLRDTSREYHLSLVDGNARLTLMKGKENVEPAVQPKKYDEAQRPQFHYTAERGWMNDPNGLCRYRGEWHFFYQANPDGLGWGDMRWGHAVSRDLVHWRQLPVALKSDQYGNVFSGSAVIDAANEAGFGKDALLLFYTAAGEKFTQRMAYSLDGRTFTKAAGEPVLPLQGHQNRDPHVFRYRDGRWVMVLYVPSKDSHNFNIYNSHDLRNWKLASVYAGPTFAEIDFYDWEVPQLFELPVRGRDERRWILMGASGNYAIGDFDGATFRPQARNVGRVIRCEEGGDWPKPNWPKFGYNSSLVYAGVEDGRTILQSWYHLFTQGEAFTQAAGLPLEVQLAPTQGGPRLAYFPVRELTCLREGGAVALEEFAGELLEAEVSCTVAPGAKVTYDFRGIGVRYDRNLGTLTICGETVPWATDYGKLALHVYQDRLGIEVFDPSGLQAFVQPKARPDRNALKLKMACEGTVSEKRSKVWRLKSIWP